MTIDNTGKNEKFQHWMSDRWWGFLVLGYTAFYGYIVYQYEVINYLAVNGLTLEQLPASHSNLNFWHMITATFLYGSLVNGFKNKKNRSVYVPSVLLLMLWSSLPQLWIFQLGYVGMIVFMKVHGTTTVNQTGHPQI